MTFLEARRIVSAFKGGEPLTFTLAMSGAADAIDIFLRAAAATRGRAAAVRTLPFNTLGQELLTPATDREVWLLAPWDFVPEADWRSGLPSAGADASDVRARAARMAGQLMSRANARFVYLDAPALPLFADADANNALASELLAHARALGAIVLPPSAFALGTYLASGNPVAAAALGDAAEAIVEQAMTTAPQPRKVIVTDFDNVLWSGVVAEDGLDGIACRAEGGGYKHFLFQTLLVRLKNEGVLVAGVSRNDEADAMAPFRNGLTELKEEDFVATLVSYHPKSAQIRALADRLNLGLDSMVFVDDNPVELAEVAAAAPDVACVEFPRSDDGIPALFDRIRALFARKVVTEEDRERTALYRRRAEGIAPSGAGGADLHEFLLGLQMRLSIHDRTAGPRDRALQLINKTNQFNINGRRLTDDELSAHLAAGARLYTASLDDRTGSHGEILSCLITRDGIVESLVLSCRVFQRRVEHAFLSWLAAHDSPRSFRFVETPRNEPARMFFQDPAFRPAGDVIAFDAKSFAERHRGDVSLFGVEAA